jgi:hypothetical protein
VNSGTQLFTWSAWKNNTKVANEQTGFPSSTRDGLDPEITNTCLLDLLQSTVGIHLPQVIKIILNLVASILAS